MHKRWKGIALPLMLLAAAFLLAGCGGASGKRPQSHTRGYDTEENLAAFRASGLFEMAEGYYGACKNSDYLTFSVDRDSEYYIDRHSPPTTPAEPFLAVVVRPNDEGEPVWSVCGGSAEAMDLSGVRTLAVCAISRRGANYSGTLSGGFGTVKDTFHGYTEDATILYLDVESGQCRMVGEVRGKDLPERAGSVPRYTLDDSKLIDRIRTDMTPPFELSEEGEITGGKLDDARNGYRFPSNVRRITQLDFGEHVSRLSLPASVESIADGVIPHKTSTRENRWGMDAPVVLTVEPGSCAETFAREGGYVYRHEESDVEYIWLAGCECTFTSVGGDYPIQPDGDLADFVTLQKTFGRSDGKPREYYVITVEEGSPAEAYAREHQYLFTYDKTVRFCLDGQEWICSDKSILVPDATTAGEALDWAVARQEEYGTALVVRQGTPAEAALAETGATYQTRK